MLRVLKPLQELCTLRLDRDGGASGCDALLIPVRYTMTGLPVHSNTFTLQYVPYSVQLTKLDN